MVKLSQKGHHFCLSFLTIFRKRFFVNFVINKYRIWAPFLLLSVVHPLFLSSLFFLLIFGRTGGGEVARPLRPHLISLWLVKSSMSFLSVSGSASIWLKLNWKLIVSDWSVRHSNVTKPLAASWEIRWPCNFCDGLKVFTRIRMHLFSWCLSVLCQFHLTFLWLPRVIRSSGEHYFIKSVSEFSNFVCLNSICRINFFYPFMAHDPGEWFSSYRSS